MNKKYSYLGAAALFAAACTLCGAGNAFAGSEEPRIIYGPGITVRSVTAPVTAGDEGPSFETGQNVMSVGEYYVAETCLFSGNIVSVDTADSSILLDAARISDEENASFEEIVFHYISGVPAVDFASGLPVSLSDLSKGEAVYAWSGNAMTMSLPPITNLQVLLVGVPEGEAPSRYVYAASASYDEETETLTISDGSGETYTLSKSGTSVSAFRTRNIVSLSDISAGSRLMIWPGGEKAVLF